MGGLDSGMFTQLCGLGSHKVARRVGFGWVATLRSAFARERGTCPSTYARCFAGDC